MCLLLTDTRQVKYYIYSINKKSLATILIFAAYTIVILGHLENAKMFFIIF